jgi:hypothetical protein
MGNRSGGGTREAGALPGLTVHVLATTREGTRCALLAAKRLVEHCTARIVLLVPRLQSAFGPGNPAADERATVIGQHRALAASIGLEVTVLFCVCRQPDDVVHQMLGPSPLVLVGGRKARFWPTREQRLVARLISEGYHAVFAQIGAERRTAPLPAGAC